MVPRRGMIQAQGLRIDNMKRAAERIHRDWHDFARLRQVEALADLYSDDAVLESPLVPAILDRASGVLRGREDILRFLQEGTRRRPNALVRWHRTGQYFTDGKTLVWEYPRETPDGDQVDILEVMEIASGSICRHRIYWGWFGCDILIKSALDKMHPVERTPQAGAVQSVVPDPPDSAQGTPAACKPPAHNAVSPYLLVRNVGKMLAFLGASFDALELSRSELPDGSVKHAEVRIDDSVVMLGERPDGREPVHCSTHVYVPDVDLAYRRALAAGASSISEPRDQPYGDRSSGVRDPEGNIWWIGTHSGHRNRQAPAAAPHTP